MPPKAKAAASSSAASKGKAAASSSAASKGKSKGKSKAKSKSNGRKSANANKILMNYPSIINNNSDLIAQRGHIHIYNESRNLLRVYEKILHRQNFDKSLLKANSKLELSFGQHVHLLLKNGNKDKNKSLITAFQQNYKKLFLTLHNDIKSPVQMSDEKVTKDFASLMTGLKMDYGIEDPGRAEDLHNTKDQKGDRKKPGVLKKFSEHTYRTAYAPSKWLGHIQYRYIANLEKISPYKNGFVTTNFDVTPENKSNLGNTRLISAWDEHLKYELYLIFLAFQIITVIGYHINNEKELIRLCMSFDKTFDDIFDSPSVGAIWSQLSPRDFEVFRGKYETMIQTKSKNNLTYAIMKRLYEKKKSNSNPNKSNYQNNFTNGKCNHCSLDLQYQKFVIDVGHYYSFSRVRKIFFIRAHQWISLVENAVGGQKTSNYNGIRTVLYEFALLIGGKASESVTNKFPEHAHCNRQHGENTVDRQLTYDDYKKLHKFKNNNYMLYTNNAHQNLISNKKLGVKPGYIIRTGIKEGGGIKLETGETYKTTIRMKIDNSKKSFKNDFGILTSFHSVICHRCLEQISETDDTKGRLGYGRLEYNTEMVSDAINNLTGPVYKNHQSYINNLWLCRKCWDSREKSSLGNNNNNNNKSNNNVESIEMSEFVSRFSAELNSLTMNRRNPPFKTTGSNSPKNGWDASQPAFMGNSQNPNAMEIENKNPKIRSKSLNPINRARYLIILKNCFNYLLVQENKSPTVVTLLNDIIQLFISLKAFTDISSSGNTSFLRRYFHEGWDQKIPQYATSLILLLIRKCKSVSNGRLYDGLPINQIDDYPWFSQRMLQKGGSIRGNSKRIQQMEYFSKKFVIPFRLMYKKYKDSIMEENGIYAQNFQRRLPSNQKKSVAAQLSLMSNAEQNEIIRSLRKRAEILRPKNQNQGENFKKNTYRNYKNRNKPTQYVSGRGRGKGRGRARGIVGNNVKRGRKGPPGRGRGVTGNVRRNKNNNRAIQGENVAVLAKKRVQFQNSNSNSNSNSNKGPKFNPKNLNNQNQNAIMVQANANNNNEEQRLLAQLLAIKSKKKGGSQKISLNNLTQLGYNLNNKSKMEIAMRQSRRNSEMSKKRQNVRQQLKRVLPAFISQSGNNHSPSRKARSSNTPGSSRNNSRQGNRNKMQN